MTRLKALAIYSAATVPLGILAHLVAETAALHRGIVDLMCRPMHAYLALLALFSFATVAFGMGRSDLRRRCALLAQALPFRGHGTAFIGVTAALQLAFVAATIAAEGDPLATGSMLSAVLAGIAAAVLGAFALYAIRSRVERLDLSTRVTRMILRRLPYRFARQFSGPYFAFIAVRGNRPPPHAFPIH